jgi:hypothetical protein
VEHGEDGWAEVIDAPPARQLTPNEVRFAQHAQSFQGLLRGVDQVGAMINQPALASNLGTWAVFGFGAFLVYQALQGVKHGNR